MLTPLLCVLAVAQAPDAQAAPPNANALVSKMFARYHDARSLSGTIRTTQVAGPASVVTETNLAYERPSKIRLEQRQKTRDGVRGKTLISDGDAFAYTTPDQMVKNLPFLREPVKPEGKPAQTIGDMYVVVASSLPDRSPTLDALIARTDDLRYFANQMANYSLVGRDTVSGKPVYEIDGDWRETTTVRTSGTFKMYITPDGDLVRYVLVQSFAPPTQSTPDDKPSLGGATITVTTTWDAAIEVNPTIKPDTFALRVG